MPLPASITVTANGRALPTRAGCSLPDFLTGLNLAPERVIVEHNGAPLTPAEARNIVLSDGDRLEIVRLTPGG